MNKNEKKIDINTVEMGFTKPVVQGICRFIEIIRHAMSEIRIYIRIHCSKQQLDFSKMLDSSSGRFRFLIKRSATLAV
jgi:hypothetical protein